MKKSTKTKPTKQKPVVTDPKDKKPEKFPEQPEFEGMETPSIPKLEAKGKEIANRRDRIKKLQTEEKGLTEEALLIMRDHEIKVYNRHGVLLRVKEMEKLEVEVND